MKSQPRRDLGKEWPGRDAVRRVACGLLLASLIGCGDTAAPLKESEIPLVQANYALKSVNGVSLPVDASYKIPGRRVSPHGWKS